MAAKTNGVVLEDVESEDEIAPSTTATCRTNNQTCGETSTNFRSDTKSLAKENSLLTPVILDRCSEVSIIGMRYVLHPSSSLWYRLVWIVLILSGVSFSSYQVRNQVLNYLSWQSDIRNRVKLCTWLQFPTVTICNENRVMKSAADKYNLTEQLRQLYSNYMSSPGNWSPIRGLSTADHPHWEDVHYNLSPKMNDSIIQGLWGVQELSLSNFTTMPTDMGYCFSFNSGDFNYVSYKPGVWNGLYLVLNVSQDEYAFTSDASIGFRILLHEKQESPQMIQKGYMVSPGVITRIDVATQQTTRLPFPYQQIDCTNAKNYSFSTCQHNCAAAEVIKYCKCKDINMKGDAPICGFNEITTCVSKYSIIKNPFDCNCLPRCTTLSYSWGFSQAPISNTFLSTLPANTDKNNLAIVEVFFSDMVMTLIDFYPAYSFMSLWCDIGGALSLILGSTLLTFVELMDVAAMLFQRFVVLRCKGSRRVSSGPTDAIEGKKPIGK